MRYLLFIMWFAVSTLATNRYVDNTSGSDSNDGLTTNTAYATISKAATVVGAGDVVHIRAGAYTNERPTLTRAGSSGSPVVWRTYQSESVAVGGWVLQTHYQTIQGFSIYGPAGPAYAGMVYAYGAYTNNTILGCTFGDGNTSCYKVYLRQTSGSDPATGPKNWLIASNAFVAGTHNETPCLQLGGTDSLVVSNVFTDIVDSDCVRVIGYNHVLRSNLFYNITNPTAAIHQDILQMFSSGGVVASNMLFECNVVTNVESQAMNLTSTTDPEAVKYLTIRNNLYADCDEMGAISCRFVTVENNTFWRSLRSTSGLGFRNADGGTAHNGVCRNNIFVECGNNPSSTTQGWYFIDAGVTNVVCDFNLVSGPDGAPKTTFSETHGINGGDVLFVSTNDWNFRLQAASPAVNAGTNLAGLFTTDLLGVTRGSSWDIGAYEYVAQTTNRVRPMRLNRLRKLD